MSILKWSFLSEKLLLSFCHALVKVKNFKGRRRLTLKGEKGICKNK